jgi:hypothetical protein
VACTATPPSLRTCASLRAPSAGGYGEGDPSVPQPPQIAKRTDLSFDWLLLDDPEAGPFYRSQTRTTEALAVDPANRIARDVVQAALHVAPDLTADMLAVDSRRVVKATVRREAHQFIEALERASAAHFAATHLEPAIWGPANFSEPVLTHAEDER